MWSQTQFFGNKRTSKWTTYLFIFEPGDIFRGQNEPIISGTSFHDAQIVNTHPPLSDDLVAKLSPRFVGIVSSLLSTKHDTVHYSIYQNGQRDDTQHKIDFKKRWVSEFQTDSYLFISTKIWNSELFFLNVQSLFYEIYDLLPPFFHRKYFSKFWNVPFFSKTIWDFWSDKRNF